MDYNETYAPVTRLETIRLIFGIAVEKDWEIRQVDIKSAYLYGDLDEEIFMKPPPGYDVPRGSVLHLKKALYGLKQAGRQWYRELKSTLTKFGLTEVPCDPHTFICHKMVKGKKCTLIIPIYVDDLLPVGDKVLTDEFETWIGSYYDVTVIGDASYFLGIRVTCTRDADIPALYLDQIHYTRIILDRFNVQGDRGPNTPLPLDESELIPNTGQATRTQIHGYQRCIGSLMYLMMGTHPDIAYAVGKLSRFVSNPSDAHFAALNRTLFYINNTNHFYLKFIRRNNGSAINPEGYVNSDYAGDRSNCRSVSGYVFFIADCTFSWHSKQQSVVATSSAEAEYIALFEATQQILWLNSMYQQFGLTLLDPIEIYCNLQSALAMAKGEHVHKAAKHIDVKIHAVRERVTRKQFAPLWISTLENVADVMTKSLPYDNFVTFVQTCRLTPSIGDPVDDSVDDTTQYIDATES